METREIQQQEWRQFFDDFSRKHGGRPIGIEILGTEIGAQIEESGLLLEGITAENEKPSDNRITIMAGANPDDHITHSITHPTLVSLGIDGNADFALAIKGSDGSTTLLRFQPAVLPGVANGSCP